MEVINYMETVYNSSNEIIIICTEYVNILGNKQTFETVLTPGMTFCCTNNVNKSYFKN